MKRRDFVSSLLATYSLPVLSNVTAAEITVHFYSAASDKVGKHSLLLLDKSGKLLSKVSLPARAHDIVSHPDYPLICAIGRRPGYYIKVIDPANLRDTYNIRPLNGFHFYGHATLLHEKGLLYTSENNVSSGDGFIFVRDLSKGGKVIANFPSNGIGPHQLKFMPDRKTIVVANGGIKTLPQSGRKKLNLDTMLSSIDYLNAETGRVIESHRLNDEFHQLSMRHIDVSNEGQVIIGAQHQGTLSEQVPLIASHYQGLGINLLEASRDLSPQIKNYTGSVVFNRKQNQFAVSSPKGNLVSIWDSATHTLVAKTRCTDVCGLAPNGHEGFIASTGNGKLYSLRITGKDLIDKALMSKQTGIAFDNHMVTRS